VIFVLNGPTPFALFAIAVLYKFYVRQRQHDHSITIEGERIIVTRREQQEVNSETRLETT
jgi:hypothetical protein